MYAVIAVQLTIMLYPIITIMLDIYEEYRKNTRSYSAVNILLYLYSNLSYNERMSIIISSTTLM